jgi:hypothetical protein
MREYVVVPPVMVADTGALREWLERAFDYASALPPKAAKTTRKRRNAR